MHSPLLTLIRKDLKGYFDQPTGYILLVIFVGVISYGFYQSAFLAGEASLRPLFTVDFTIERPSLPWLLAIFVPAATMRLIAEEQRDGTLELLLTQPIRGWIVLLAKFLAGLMFVVVAIAATAGIPIALATAGDLDEGAVIAQYTGSLFLAASFVSIGLFTSSLTRNQIVAWILGLTFSAVLMIMGLEVVVVSLPARVAGLLQQLSPATHFSSMARGIIDLRDVLYFIALVSTFLSATFLMIRARTLSHQSPQYRNLQLGVVGLIVFSLLVGWFGSSITGRIDLTEDKLFTMSPATSDILANLDDILTVELFESKDPPVQVSLVARDVNDFLDDFAASSRGRVKLVHRFPDEEEDAARKAQNAGVPAMQFNVQSQGELQIKTGYLGVAMTYVDRREVIPFVRTIDGFEYLLATMAFKMIQQERKTIAFLTGHGEKAQDTDLRNFAGWLGQQYEVRDVQATEDEPLDLTGVDVLIVPGPTERIPAEVQEVLRDYVDGGGKAMFLVDAVRVDPQQWIGELNRNSLAGFVERYGVVVEDDLVFDLRSNETLSFSTQGGNVFLPYPYWVRVPVASPKVTGNVGSVVLPWASSIGISESEVGRVEVLPLLETTEFAAIDFDYRDVRPNTPIFDQVTQQNLVQSLMGVAVERLASEAGTGANSGAFRLVVMGNSAWITDALVSRSQENLTLALNLVDWLAQEDALASIREKVVSSRDLKYTSTHQNIMQYSNIIGVPLAFVLLGLLRFISRRSKGFRIYWQPRPGRWLGRGRQADRAGDE